MCSADGDFDSRIEAEEQIGGMWADIGQGIFLLSVT